MSSSRTEALGPIPEQVEPTPEQFRAEILPSGEPAVLRGIARDWPLVIAARRDAHEAMALLEAAAGANLTSLLRTEPGEEGRFHYSRGSQSTFNFIRGHGNVAGILAALRDQEQSYRPSAIAAQAMPAERYFPTFAQSHPMPLVPPAAAPRLWIGNAAKIATHNDPMENVAVVAAGRRRFTLFPPTAEADLYMGPHHPTPAGARISMVHVTAPDLDRFPRFVSALKVAQEAELSPGDGIFIPRDWFHHVEALERFNVLVNYWWDANKDAA
jgi:Cupin-like domain